MSIHNKKNNYLSKLFCSGCGICVLVCKEKAITLIKNVRGFSPIINGDRCNQCGLCSKSCPIIQGLFDRSPILKNISEYTASDLLGYYHASYAAYCINDAIRRRASSGGIMSALLIYMLEKDLVDGAAIVVQNSNFKSTCDLFISKIARTKNEVLEAQGSKYVQISMEDSLEEIRQDPSLQRFAYVGTGCQIRALKRNIKRIPGIKDITFHYFGLFCKQNKIPEFTNYLFDIVHYNIKDISRFRYREGGDSGWLSINNENILNFKDWKYGFLPWYVNAYGCDACLVCGDCTAEEADISFGDAWLPQYEEKANNLGYSLLLTRSKFGDWLIKRMAEENIIAIEEIDPSLIAKSQPTQKILIKKSSSGIFGWILNRRAKITMLEDIFSNQKPSIVELMFGLNYLFWSHFFSWKILRKFIVYFEKHANLGFRLVIKWNRVLEQIYLNAHKIQKKNRR